MNKRDVMFIRPSDCRYCLNGYYGIGHVVDYAADKAFNIMDLEREQADNPYIDNTINSFQPFLIYGFGHGNVNVYTANSETPVWHTGEPLTHLAGKVIYLLSCLTAQQLGPYMIDQGALGYGGFLISWTWMTGNVNGDPYEDKYAKGFYKSTNKFFEALLDGMTLEQAMQASIAEYNYWIYWWENSGEDNASEVVKWLLHDRDGLVIYGDPTASTVDCSEITDRQECLDSGCWWYNGACHCEPPSDVRAQYPFTVETYPAFGAIVKFDVWYPHNYILDNDSTFIEFNIYLKNAGRGYAPIFAQLRNAAGDIVWSKTRNLRPGQTEKNPAKIRNITQDDTYTLEVGHIEDGEKIVDETRSHITTVEHAKWFGGLYGGQGHTWVSQAENRDRAFAVQYEAPEDGQVVAIEPWIGLFLYLPDAKADYAVYKVSDGSLVAKGKRTLPCSGTTQTFRCHFDTPGALVAGEKYWLVIHQLVNSGGFQLTYRDVKKPNIEGTMTVSRNSNLPDTFIPVLGDREFYIRCIYL